VHVKSGIYNHQYICNPQSAICNRRLPPTLPSTLRPRVGISACLLGEAVRYDGGHKRDAVLIDALGRRVEWVAVCPEVEIGLGTPREPIQLVWSGDVTRLRAVATGVDLTERMSQYAGMRVAALAKQNLSGYVFKARSPSCGVKGVKIYDQGPRVGDRGLGAGEQEQGARRSALGAGEELEDTESGATHASGDQRRRFSRGGRGLFADELIHRYPNLPVEEETGLSDARRRAAFIERVFAYQAVRTLFTSRWTPQDLASFHASYRPAVVSRSASACHRLDRLAADAATRPRRVLADQYEAVFMQTLARRPRRHSSPSP
jgi:uncharacterized protein YbbK (DUF523 family)